MGTRVSQRVKSEYTLVPILFLPLSSLLLLPDISATMPSVLLASGMPSNDTDDQLANVAHDMDMKGIATVLVKHS